MLLSISIFAMSSVLEPTLEVVTHIPRTARGKRRLMIQHIKAEGGARAA